MNPLVGPFPEKLIQSEQLGSRMIRSTCLPLTDPSRDSSMMSGSEQIAKQTLSTIRNMQKTITFWNTWSRNENVKKKSGPNIKIWAERIPFFSLLKPLYQGNASPHAHAQPAAVSSGVRGTPLTSGGTAMSSFCLRGAGISHECTIAEHTFISVSRELCPWDICLIVFFPKGFCRRRRDSEDSFEIML